MEDSSHRKPSAHLSRLLESPAPPQILPSPDSRRALLLESTPLPPLSQLTRPMCALAGLRFNPRTDSPFRCRFIDGVRLLSYDDGQQHEITIPPGNRCYGFNWSPDGSRVLFFREVDDGTELWSIESHERAVKRLIGPRVISFVDSPYCWCPDGSELIIKLRSDETARTLPAIENTAALRIQDSSGEAAQLRTYQDLLASPADDAAFEKHVSSQLARLDLSSGTLTELGTTGLYRSISVSPSGTKLLVSRYVGPWSYLVPLSHFAHQLEVWSLDTNEQQVIGSVELAETIPIKGVRQGMRHVHWHPQRVETLVFVEALDGGDPQRTVPHRDRIVCRDLTANDEEYLRVEHRLVGLDWLTDNGGALITEYDWRRRWTRVSLDEKILFDRSSHDAYRDPGVPVKKRASNGTSLVLHHAGAIFLHGMGATPDGNRPFLTRYRLDTGHAEELFRSSPPPHREFRALLDADGPTLLVSSQCQTAPPHLEIVTGNETRQLTSEPNHIESFTALDMELLNYHRDDGVPLSGELILPPGHQPGDRHPVLIWAYPRAYSDPTTAGQVKMSPHRFPSLTARWHRLLALEGYVVLDRATVPIVGEPTTMNDSYVEQVVSSLAAAIAALDERGCIDRNAVALGGHSYGAFMVANALAHSNLFSAGIASSGAYNRTLTPFGFQGERRTLWEAPETYIAMSPFIHADKIDCPLLLVHGERDDNAGTYPMQSERFFAALNGLGIPARLVMLPLESHHYRSRENVLHFVAEMVDWLENHLSPAKRHMVPPSERQNSA